MRSSTTVKELVAPEQAVPMGRDAQPLSRLHWIPRTQLRANSYNPNRVAPPELELLKRSILEDGWTQPIVVRRATPLPDVDETGAADTHDHELYEIVDGFHRWTVSADPQIHALTDGYVPCVILRDVDLAHQEMSTVRHNRARGSHHVVKMSDIVIDLLDNQRLTRAEVAERLGMEREEVDRLYERGNMTKRGANAEGTFNRAWVPVPGEHQHVPTRQQTETTLTNRARNGKGVE